MTKKAESIVRLTEAIESMGFTMSSIDLHRLHYFTRKTLTRTATVKALRNAVAQFRLDPLKLLEKRGVGVKTLHSVQLLSGLLAGQETQKEFGHEDNLAAVQAILNTMNRGIPDNVRVHVNNAKSNLTHAQNLLQFNSLPIEQDSVPLKRFVLCAYYNCEGDCLDIVNICGNIVLSVPELQYGVERCIADIEHQRDENPDSYVERYTSEFVDSKDDIQGVYLLVKAHCVDTST